MIPFQPKFCCQCGEKIDETEQTFWTSRRFCRLCATEFGIYERIPQFLSGIIVILGLFGIGSYLLKSEKPPVATSRQLAVVSNVSEPATRQTTVQAASAVNVQQATPNGNFVSQLNAPPVPSKSNLKSERTAAPNEPTEKVYFCGAPTKKGTMCSRRVKNGGRCWQHEGQEALLPPDKLLAAR